MPIALGFWLSVYPNATPLAKAAPGEAEGLRTISCLVALDNFDDQIANGRGAPYSLWPPKTINGEGSKNPGESSSGSIGEHKSQVILVLLIGGLNGNIQR